MTAMFNNRMRPVEYRKAIASKNSLHENVVSYQAPVPIIAAVSFNTRSMYAGNDANILMCEYVALTEHPGIARGDLVAGYRVEFVQGRILYLKEVGNLGKA